MIALAAVELAPAVFEVTPDGSKIRRKIPFDSKEVAEAAAREAISQNVVEATGFARSTSTAEVQTYFSRFGPITSVQMTQPPSKGIFHVEFQSIETMVNVLARPHTYEDQKIQVRGCSKDFDNQHSSSSVVATSLESHAGLSTYPRNRVLQFTLADSDIKALVIKAALEQFALVNAVELEKESLVGYIKFKKSVAKDVVSIIARQGGLQMNGEMVHVRALEGKPADQKLSFLDQISERYESIGDEERLYWEVNKVKETMAVAEPKVTDAQTRRIASRKQRRSERGPYGQRKDKRGRSQRHSKPANKKVKVDDLEAMFSTWGTDLAESPAAAGQQ